MRHRPCGASKARPDALGGLPVSARRADTSGCPRSTPIEDLISLGFLLPAHPLERFRCRACSHPGIPFRPGMERNRTKIVPVPGCCHLTGSRSMSRAFVNDAEYLEELPERPVSQHPNDVTEAGLAQIEHPVPAAIQAKAKAQQSTHPPPLH